MENPSASPAHSELYQAVHALYLANSAEAHAKAQRIAHEEYVKQKIEEIYGKLPIDGSKTFVIDNYKVTLTNRTNFSLADKSGIQKLQAVLPHAVVTKLELQDTVLKNLRDSDPAMYLHAVPFIVSKPAKTNFKIISSSEE